MKVRNLGKTLRSTAPGGVPADLRDRLVEAIPAEFRLVSAGPVRGLLVPTRRKLVYLAIAASLLIAGIHFTGVMGSKKPRTDHLAGTSFGFVSVAVADVVRNLENFGALYVEMDLRTGNRENFEFIAPENDFTRVKIWLERPTERFKKGRMRVKKEERRTIFNGETTLFYDTENGEAKLFQGGRVDAQLSGPARWVRDSVPPPGASVSLDTLANGRGSSIARLTIRETGAPLEPGSSPVFFSEFDRRIVIFWETNTRRLTDLEKYVTQNGKEVLVAKIRSIEYRDQFADDVFSQKLPEGIHIMEVADSGNQQYSEMEPEEVARVMFTAWMNEDWDKVRVFCESRLIITYMKTTPLASFKITGPKFKRNPKYPGWQVPYELVFKNGGVKRLALALRNDNKMKRYIWDGGL
ncbi:MAG: hypothetical protein EXS64_14995 [Candidatus Latescibacteria bacterium]|nr:hypothetical protein [Candidatus Latescibacterota bacterium]